MHNERKLRNIDPFELQIFHEEQSAAVKEYKALVEQDQENRMFDQISKAPSNSYQAFSQQKQQKKKP